MASKPSASGRNGRSTGAGSSAKSNQNRRDVSPDAAAPAGQRWKVTKPGQTTPTATARTQGAAEKAAKQQTSDAGGGQVYIHRPDGTIRDADTVAPGNESSAKDTKH